MIINIMLLIMLLLNWKHYFLSLHVSIEYRHYVPKNNDCDYNSTESGMLYNIH